MEGFTHDEFTGFEKAWKRMFLFVAIVSLAIFTAGCLVFKVLFM